MAFLRGEVSAECRCCQLKACSTHAPECQNKTVVRFLLSGLIAAFQLAAQTLEVHSEFLRVNPQGEILLTDATPKPREFLSPGIVRNGFASFHVVVRSPRPTSYFLLVGTNPPNILRTAIYKEQFVQRGEDWIPDTLELLRSPNFGVIPDAGGGIPGQTACSYLLDVWVPPDAPADTIRLEVQLKMGTWTIYPMEVRVLPARVPARAGVADPLPEIEQRADEAAMAPLLGYMGRHGEGPAATQPPGRSETGTAPGTLREVIRRNAEQDMALARGLDTKTLLPALKEKLAPTAIGGEWYLGIRDLIYRLSSKAPPRD